jgi:hypothetical protein
MGYRTGDRMSFLTYAGLAVAMILMGLVIAITSASTFTSNLEARRAGAKF